MVPVVLFINIYCRKRPSELKIIPTEQKLWFQCSTFGITFLTFWWNSWNTHGIFQSNYGNLLLKDHEIFWDHAQLNILWWIQSQALPSSCKAWGHMTCMISRKLSKKLYRSFIYVSYFLFYQTYSLFCQNYSISKFQIDFWHPANLKEVWSLRTCNWIWKFLFCWSEYVVRWCKINTTLSRS